MNTNKTLYRAPLRPFGAFGFGGIHFDKDTENAGTGEDLVLKAIDGVKTSLEKFVTKTDMEGVSTKLQTLEQKVASITVGEPNLAKDAKGGFKHLGDFALAAYNAVITKDVDERLTVLTKGAGTPTGSSTLDFPLPAGFIPGIKETPYTEDNLLDLVTRLPIEAGQESVELTYADDLDRSSGAIRGGIKAYWKSEAEQMTGDKPKVRTIKLTPQELYVFSYATEKLLRNSPMTFGSWLMQAMQRAIPFKVGDAIVNGDGVGKPLGLLNSPDLITVAKETSQGAATINHVNIEKMWARMPAWMRANSVWLANQDTEQQFPRMARSAIKNDGTALESADTPGAYDERTNTLKGRPIKYVEYCPTIGTVGDLILWAPQHYLVAEKAGSGMEESIHLRFDYAERAFRVIKEIDGRSEFPGILTPYKGSVTRSAIVALATRA